jgi:23S rRNA pseudouridine2605 synthase
MDKRLNKFIAENTEFSRRKADELIKRGKVSVNGQIAELGTRVDPDNDQVVLNGTTISTGIPLTYVALNKPAGYISTRKDEEDRKTVMELVPKGKNLKLVGRLDKDTEGLLLLSNDGDFINRVTHPSFECEKEYYALVKGKLKNSSKKELENGVVIEERKTAKAKIHILKATNEETSLKITIHEGRKRQIRKMFDHTHNPVKYLQRVRIGSIKLGSITKGKYRLLSKAEINAHKPSNFLHSKND